MIIIESCGLIKVYKHLTITGNKSMMLVNNITNELIDIETSILEGELYYTVTLNNVPDGEYTYFIKKGNDILETGLLRIGQINITNKNFTAENKVYTYERQ